MINKEHILNEIAVAEEGVEYTNTATSDYREMQQTGSEEQNEPNEQPEVSEETVPETNDEGYVIDGEVFSQEDIREWRQGYLRQSDYTRKTQELSQEREKVKDAMELYDYLKANPDIAEQLANQNGVAAKAPTQENKAIQELNYRLATMELDNQLNNIKAKDSSIDEVQLLNIANQNNCSLDVAYNIYRGMNFDKILEQKLKEQSSKLTEEIKQNGSITKTLISNADKPNNTGNYGLSNDEVIMAGKLGMSLEEYSKWK